MRARSVSLLIVAVVALAGLATVVIPRLKDDSNSNSTSNASYCSTLSSKQTQLSEILGSSDPTALVDNLALFKTLATNAPADIVGSWTALNTAIASLQTAIQASGHRPADFAGGKFPAGLSIAQRQSISAAADTLSSPTTVNASKAIDQEVRDVCQINLGM
jgi:hypothetical protein